MSTKDKTHQFSMRFEHTEVVVVVVVDVLSHHFVALGLGLG